MTHPTWRRADESVQTDWNSTMRRYRMRRYSMFSIFYFVSLLLTLFFRYYYPLRCTQHCDNDMAMTTQQHATTGLPRYIQHNNFKLTWCRRHRADESVRWGKQAIQTYQGMISFLFFHFISVLLTLFMRYYYSTLHRTLWQWHGDDDSTTCHNTSTTIHPTR